MAGHSDTSSMSYLIRHTHSSSGRDRDEALLADDFLRWSVDSNLITLTGSLPIPSETLDLRGWKTVSGTEGVHLAYEKTVWEAMDAEVVCLPLDPLCALFVILHHQRTGKTLVKGVACFPQGSNLRTQARCIREVKAHLRRLRRFHDAHATAFTATWNVNLKNPWVRRGFKILLPKMVITFKPPFPKEEKQIVEFTLAWCLSILQGPRLLAARSSNRKSFRQVLAFK